MATYPGLNESEGTALEFVASALKTDPQWLWEVINFESRQNPLAMNSKSSAKGLIQFIDSTAKSLGYTNSYDLIQKNPTYEGQIKGPVLKYFQSAAPYKTRQALYMKVFYPAAATVSPDTTFQSLYGTNNTGFALFQKENPGIDTVADYVTKTMNAANGKLTAKTISTLKLSGTALAIIAIGAGWFFFIRKPKSKRTRQK